MLENKLAGDDNSQYRNPQVSKLFIIKLCKLVVPLRGSPMTNIGDLKSSTFIFNELLSLTPQIMTQILR